MSELVKAAILGIVQGITEFLPISSSAHLLALREVLEFHLEGIAFDVSVHVATLLAVLIYFRKEIAWILAGEHLRPVLLRIALATLPAVALGILLRGFRESISGWFAVGGWTFSAAYLLSTRPLLQAAGRAGEQPYARLSLWRTLAVGAAQALAIFPGVSRSGASIAAGLWVGLEREQAARFSFLLAIPAILGAGVLEALKLARSPESIGDFGLSCAVGMPAALLVGLGAIHLLLRVVRSRHFHRFGWYNLAAAAAFCAYLAAKG